jgi:outer membrane protein assembly factor BamB
VPATAPPAAEAQAESPLKFPLQAAWTATLADFPSFPPAYDGEFGYFALRNDQLVAVSLEDGKPAWSVECPTSSAPTAGGGLVFTGGAAGIESRSQKDGQLVWTQPIEGRITSLYWDTGWLIATTDKGPLSVARATDGERLWQRDLGAPLHSVPALAGDRLYVSLNDGRIIALSLQKGDVLWTSTLDKPGEGILALAERLYVGSLDDWFYCLDTKDGKRKWRWRNDADVVGMPVIDRRRIYFVALDNVLRALNRGGGSLFWKRAVPMRPSSGPLLTENLLIVPGLAAELHGYSVADGAPAGDFVLKGSQGEELQLAAPPHLTAHNSIVIMTKNGQLQALGTAPHAAAPVATPAAVPAAAPVAAPGAAPGIAPGAKPEPVAPGTATEPKSESTPEPTTPTEPTITPEPGAETEPGTEPEPTAAPPPAPAPALTHSP